MNKENVLRKKMIIVGIMALAVFLLLFFLVKNGLSQNFDEAIMQFFYDVRCSWLTPFMKAITYMGNWQTVTAISIVLLIVKKTRRIYGLPVAIGAVAVSVGNKLIKELVLRPRPDNAFFLISQEGYSFPSGHSITSMFVYGMLICLIQSNVKNKRTANILTVLLAVPMILVGISRMYVGVHYPTDVFAGWCLGIVAIVILFRIFNRISVKEDTL